MEAKRLRLESSKQLWRRLRQSMHGEKKICSGESSKYKPRKARRKRIWSARSKSRRPSREKCSAH
jgi:hypothetical protein